MKVNRIKKAFTLTELIVVVAVIWILMMWITVYVWWLWERAKIIEAQWCSVSFWWEMNNYVFYALTSKNLRTEANAVVSPNYYYIQLTWWTSTNLKNCSKTNYTWSDWTYCNKVVFWYGYSDNGAITTYKTYDIPNTCHQNQAKLWFFWSGWDTSNIKYIKMNKWFAPTSIAERKVFLLQHDWNNETDKLLKGDIIIVLCADDACRSWKEIGKRNIDARSQSISFNKCRFYQEDQSKCEAREE